YCPLLGESRQPIKFMSVDFPDPLGPMMATYSLRAIRRSTPQGMDLLLQPHVIGLPQILRADHAGSGRRGNCRGGKIQCIGCCHAVLLVLHLLRWSFWLDAPSGRKSQDEKRTRSHIRFEPIGSSRHPSCGQGKTASGVFIIVLPFVAGWQKGCIKTSLLATK